MKVYDIQEIFDRPKDQMPSVFYTGRFVELWLLWRHEPNYHQFSILDMCLESIEYKPK